ncbi:hypothetical protein ACFFK0_04955 [Paenibacillus chartarius]|uniref:Uncharacterized protein n=1 Tax=Paenibacillus chartarius TaxID=747481 RepID=A0ABV6DGQ7_9BACL
MRKKLLPLFLVVLLAASIAASQAAAKDGIAVKYDFQEVKVLFAAEFTAYPQGYVSPKEPASAPSAASSPVTAAVYSSVNGWVYGAGTQTPVTVPDSGPKPLKVMYGVVELVPAGGYSSFTEQFIKVSDGTNSLRALSNGLTNRFAGSRVIGMDTNFLTGKKLEGSSVVKDYSDGMNAIYLSRSWDEYFNMTNVSLSFQADAKGSPDAFFRQLAQTSYTVDMGTWKQVGNPGVN